MRDEIPFLGNTWVILLIFLGALLTFDLLFVRWSRYRLGTIGWKRVDYIWLSLTLISVIGYTTQSRAVLAKYLSNNARERMDVVYGLLGGYVRMYDKSPAICRTFVRSPYSPPEEQFKRTQAEFDAACGWFSQVAQAIPKSRPPQTTEVPWRSLPSPPPVTNAGLKEDIEVIRQSVEEFNASGANFKRLESETQRHGSEEVLLVISPLLIAFALALRITKVTGEIRIERLKGK